MATNSSSTTSRHPQRATARRRCGLGSAGHDGLERERATLAGRYVVHVQAGCPEERLGHRYALWHSLAQTYEPSSVGWLSGIPAGYTTTTTAWSLRAGVPSLDGGSGGNGGSGTAELRQRQRDHTGDRRAVDLINFGGSANATGVVENNTLVAEESSSEGGPGRSPIISMTEPWHTQRLRHSFVCIMADGGPSNTINSPRSTPPARCSGSSTCRGGHTIGHQ